MQKVNPFRMMLQKMRGLCASPLDGFSSFYLGLESVSTVGGEELLSADPLLLAAEAIH